jgi:hypothetical protein
MCRSFQKFSVGGVVAGVLVVVVASCGGNEPAEPQPELPKPANVSGKLLRSTGGGISAAVVRLTDSSDDTVTAYTAIDGTFSFPGVPAGAGTVSFDSLPPECEPPAALNYLAEAGGTASLSATAACVASVGEISGRLLSQASDTLSAVSVTVLPTLGTGPAAIVSDSDGSFAFSNVPTGFGFLRFRGFPGPCKTPDDVPYKLAFREALQIPVTVTCDQIGHLEGTVKDSYGNLLTNRGITILPNGSAAITGVTTDFQGVFNQPYVPTGSGVITVSGVGLPSICTPAPRGYSDLHFNERRTVELVVPCFRGQVGGKVVSSQGGVRGDVTVELNRGGASLIVSTDLAGMYLFDSLPAGEGKLHIAGGWNGGQWCGAADTSFTLASESAPVIRNLTVPCSGIVTVYGRRSTDNTLLRVGQVSVAASRPNAVGAVTYLMGSPLPFAGPDADSATVRLFRMPENCIDIEKTVGGLFTHSNTVVDLTATCGGELRVSVRGPGGYVTSADVTVRPKSGPTFSASSVGTAAIISFRDIASDSGEVELTRISSGCLPLKPTPFVGLTKTTKLELEIYVSCPPTNGPAATPPQPD